MFACGACRDALLSRCTEWAIARRRLFRRLARPRPNAIVAMLLADDLQLNVYRVDQSYIALLALLRLPA